MASTQSHTPLSGPILVCMQRVPILTMVFTFSAPGQNRRQGSKSTGWNSGCLVRFVTVSKSQRCSATPHRQHNNHCLYKGNGRDPLPLLMQEKPSVVTSSHQEESHSSPLSVDFHTEEQRGGFPQQTQSAEVGFQTSPIIVLKDLLETASLAHTGCFSVQREL